MTNISESTGQIQWKESHLTLFMKSGNMKTKQAIHCSLFVSLQETLT
jgi:hypothetical protein